MVTFAEWRIAYKKRHMALKYYLTAAGKLAVSEKDAEATLLPLEYRRLLGLIEVDGHVDVLRGRLRRFPDRLIAEWLKELEYLKLIESGPAGKLKEFTFTGQRVPLLPPLADEDSKRLARDAVIAGATLLRSAAALGARSILADHGAEVIKVEPLQGEGGINVASAEWLRGLSELCQEYGILLILDDIQMGCGRTGKFFSFEEAGITPDIVTLSKSISGYGLPMALTLFKRELDVWEPGEHNGTFRGFNPAMVTGAEALRRFWSDDAFAQATIAKGDMVQARLAEMAAEHADFGAHVRGRGLARGLAFDAEGGIAKQVAAESFDRGLLLETSGPEDEVAKLLPPLTATEEELTAGLDIMADAARAAVKAAAQPA